ncbi:MAG: hypothetical protein E6Q32_03145 [Neisseriales bacterium]|nr:MAG: hypothetical protein E6Q32_03145 [Neisseriales bacterium]
MNKVIAVLTDLNGNLIENTNFPFLKLALKDLDIKCNEKKLLANMLDKNYTVYKTQINLSNNDFFQYLFEEWKINNNINLSIDKVQVMNTQLKDINSFTDFEREIIYSLLSGYVIDKAIEQFLIKLTNQKLRGNVRYTIAALYSKFECDNRSLLIELLKYYELDRYLPVSIFPPGVYKI